VRQASFFKAMPAIVWQILFFYLPVGFIAALSFWRVADRTLTLDYYINLFNPLYFLIIGRSFVLAAVTTLACLLVGYPIAYFLGLSESRFKNVCFFFLIIPFWTNLLVLAYAWFFLLDRDGLLNMILVKLSLISQPLSLLNTPLATFLVMFYCYLPFMIMPLFTILEKFDMTLIEASRDLGATAWQTFFKVIFPLSYRGIRTGFLVVFVPAFGEFAIPYLVGGDKQMYVGSLIMQLFLIADQKSAGAAFTVVSCLLLLIVVGIVYKLLDCRVGDRV